MAKNKNRYHFSQVGGIVSTNITLSFLIPILSKSRKVLWCCCQIVLWLFCLSLPSPLMLLISALCQGSVWSLSVSSNLLRVCLCLLFSGWSQNKEGSYLGPYYVVSSSFYSLLAQPTLHKSPMHSQHSDVLSVFSFSVFQWRKNATFNCNDTLIQV